MSKERARRREERERESGIKAAARAQEVERRERRQALARRLKQHLPIANRPTGALAERRRRYVGGVLVAVLLLQVVVWVVRPDWEARLASAVVTLILLPLLLTFAARASRRR